MEKINSILTREKCSKWLDTPHILVFGWPIPMAQVLRLYIQMFVSYGRYVFFILETAHHRTIFRLLCNITQNTTPEENSQKMFYISLPICTFFLQEGQGHFGGIKIKFHLGRAKGRIRGVVGEEAQNEGYFCKIPIIKQDTCFISQTFGQTNF